jgi:hypothetical protein
MSFRGTQFYPLHIHDSHVDSPSAQLSGTLLQEYKDLGTIKNDLNLRFGGRVCSPHMFLLIRVKK